MKEIWKDIKGYGGYYKISNKGRVKSLKRIVNHPQSHKMTIPKKILKQKHNGDYFFVRLSKNGIGKNMTIHRIVAMTFIPNPENKPEVNHIDGNKNNNNVLNFEWVTNSENQIHAHKLGLNHSPRYWKGKFGSEHNTSRSVIQYSINGEYINEFGSLREAARIIGISNSTISNVCNGKQKTSAGFIWKFKEKKQ